ncbi:MAG: NAD+ synthase, partial [Actinomycetota bacterium]|nr:NAD+ synthase [Actinomycetota bacterium]
MRRIRVAAAQLNVCVGDLDGNVELIIDAYRAGAEAGADVVVFSELSITGYPPEDLLLKTAFVREAEQAVARLAAEIGDVVAVVGYPDSVHDLHNAAAVLHRGEMAGSYHKQVLPNYSVFDEQRYFVPGTEAGPLYEIAGVRVGITVCEDIWSPVGPYADQAAGGAELLLNINGSPFRRGKQQIRESLLETRAADVSVPIVYVNQVGGQDELVFDGGSVVIDQTGALVARARRFESDLLVVDIEVPLPYRARLLDPRGRRHEAMLPVIELTPQPESFTAALEPRVEDLHEPLGETWQALVTATRDYTLKNGFSEAVIALSGGIDSSIVAALASDALGPENVHGVAMPSRFSSDGSRDDAAKLAANFGIDFRTIEIEEAHSALLGMLAESFDGTESDTTEENLQSRIRGVVLMALSNKFGWMVLTTGNKSESAVGYTTLYGDTAGGYAVIKDVPKLLVYELCRWRNRQAGSDIIPESVLDKAPSAELRPGQRDDQSLPPYDQLDPLLEAYV